MQVSAVCYLSENGRRDTFRRVFIDGRGRLVFLCFLHPLPEFVVHPNTKVLPQICNETRCDFRPVLIHYGNIEDAITHLCPLNEKGKVRPE